jgi:heptosyltransferase-2
MRIGVFLPNWVGDVVMATPAIRALRKLADRNSSSAALVGVMRPYVAEVLAGSSWFDDVVLYSKKKTDDPSLRWPAARGRLRQLRLDMVVLLTNSLRTGWMAYRSGATRRVGTGGNLRRWLLTDCIDSPRHGRRRTGRGGVAPAVESTVEGYLRVVAAAGCGHESKRLELHTTAEDRAAADAVWRRLELPDEPGRVAVLNTGGAFGAAKDWPAEHFAALAGRLARHRQMHVLVNCGPAERDAVRRIVAAADDPRVVSLADEPQLPIGLTKACIERAGLLVTTDSGPRFFGVALGVPTVALFGPTSVEFTRTDAPNEVRLSLGLDCQPCMERVCPLKHHMCMRDLSVDRVFSTADALLQQYRRHVA